MGFSDKDKILIKNLHDSKEYLGYGAKKLIKSVPFKSWSKRELSCSVISSRERQIHTCSADELKRRFIDVCCTFHAVLNF